MPMHFKRAQELNVKSLSVSDLPSKFTLFQFLESA